METPGSRSSEPRLTLTVVVPATNRPATLPQCLEAIDKAADKPEQVIVEGDTSITHPATARNAGARHATGDVLVFIDADVTVHADAFTRIRRAFETDPGLTALFGSYDDAPSAPGIVSRFRNLLHHHVHQQNAGRAGTFWSGLGAIRRQAFESCGGFSVHPIEDIELGMRLAQKGARIILDPAIQGKHLKDWSLWNMMRTDLLVRGIPWVGLLIQHRGSANASALNLSLRHRLSALASLLFVLAAAFLQPVIAGAALAALIALNFSFYQLLARREGLVRALAGILVHVVHHLVSVAAVPLGIAAHLARQWRRPTREAA